MLPGTALLARLFMIMPVLTLITVLVPLSLVAFGIARARARARACAGRCHSLPHHHGQFAALATLLPGLAVAALWGATDSLLRPALGYLPFAPDGRTLDVLGAVLATGASLGGFLFAWRRLAPAYRARNAVERMIKIFMILCATLAVLTTGGIVASLLFESSRFFAHVPLTEFLFGLHWSPQMAIRTDQVGASGAFGAVPLFTGTLLIAGIAMAVAVPIGLFAAIYTAEYAAPGFRTVAKPLLEILAGIPTVVYGFFAALTVAPFLRDAGVVFGVSISSESALAAGVVMGVMIIPFVSSLADDVISAVPRALREGSLSLGATRSETICRVVLPAALPGVVGGILLAVSRAIGETMIVVMAAGLSARLTANPFEAVTTVTVQIVSLLVGDQEFDSPKTLAAFALGLMLFIITLLLNVIALYVVRRYKEQYE
ncbi:MAG: phosphate transport system permease protein [Rhodospirillaceae bacterium]|nr:MAG: phosphate transport system permease protein [Rhodospirillaceae bacterium]